MTEVYISTEEQRSRNPELKYSIRAIDASKDSYAVVFGADSNSLSGVNILGFNYSLVDANELLSKLEKAENITVGTVMTINTDNPSLMLWNGKSAKILEILQGVVKIRVDDGHPDDNLNNRVCFPHELTSKGKIL